MPRVAHLWPEPSRRAAESVEVGARFETPRSWARPWRSGRRRVFFRVPEALAPDEHAIADAFLLGALFPALRRARTSGVRTFRLHGRVSGDLLANARRLGELAVSRTPDAFGPVEIVADGVVEGVAPSGAAVLPFSGGLDSSWSLLRGAARARAGEDGGIGLAFMIHGADIPLDEAADFERAFARAGRIARACAVPLVRVETDIRSLKQKWTYACNATLGAILTLFRRGYGSGRNATGYGATEGAVWWPADLTDPPLTSCVAFPILPDGTETERPTKMEDVLREPAIAENLRVCYRAGVYDRNCGECAKCRVGMLLVQAITGGGIPAFPRAATDDDVHGALASGDPRAAGRLAEVAGLARRHGRDGLADRIARELERSRPGAAGRTA